MPLIVHHPEPFDIHKSKSYNVDAGVNFLDWLVETYGNCGALSNGLSTDILFNGRSIFRTDDPECDESALGVNLGHNDEIKIINRPAGIDPFTIALVVVAAVAAAALVVALKPDNPGDAGVTRTSPNNDLQAAQNSFRPGQAIPEIFGLIPSYPDFAQPSYFEYINNQKIVRELFVVGVGTYDITDVKFGETPIAGPIIYDPGVLPADDLLTVHRGTSEVDGQVLVAPNDESISQTDQVDSVAADGIVNTTITLDASSTLTIDMDLQVNDYLTVNIEDAGASTLLSGTFEVLDIDTSGSNVIIELDTLTGTAGTAGTDPNANSVTKTDSAGAIDNWLGWFNVPGDDAEEVWFHWQMPRGIRSDEGKKISVSLRLQIEELDSGGSPTGNTFTKTVSRSGNTQNPQLVTSKFTRAEFPGMSSTQYRARAKRFTGVFPSGSSDEVKMEDFVSVTPYTNPSFGDVTMMSLERQSTTFAITSGGNKINCMANRKLPVYDRILGTYDVGTLAASRDFADAVAYSIIVAGGRSATTVDLEELYSINDGLHGDLRAFDFSFDEFNTGLGERVQTICNAARVAAYRDGATWVFTRDEEKPVRSAMFNRRSMPTSTGSTQGWQLQRPDDKDSVQLTYIDPAENVERILYRRVSGGQILTDAPGNHPLEIKLTGCRNFYQASNRADLEIRRLIHQRRTVNDTVTRDGLLVGINDRVGWVDPNDGQLFEGEILGISGTTYDTSERFTPESGIDYFVYLTDDDGNPSSSVIAQPRPETEFGFIAAGLSGAYLPSGDQQVGSRYFIGSSLDHAAGDFSITRRAPNPDGTVNLEMAEYVPVIYEVDAADPPGPGITLPGSILASDPETTPAGSTATLTFFRDGTYDGDDLGDNGEWSALPSATVGDAYEIRATVISGSTPTGSAVGAFIPLSSDVSWELFKSGAASGQDSAVLNVEIREAAYPDKVANTTATITAIVNDPISLPASVTVTAEVEVGLSIASFVARNDGTFEGIAVDGTNTSGNYVDTLNGVGDLYEIKATLSAGTTPEGSPLGSFIQLSGSGVEWIIESEGLTVTSTLTVEIREISNPSNTDTMTVSLSAEAGVL